MRQRRKHPYRKKLSRRLGSLAFFLAIPTCYVAGCISLITLLFLWNRDGFQAELGVPFICGLVGTIAIFSLIRIEWLRTFVHEVKHYFVVLLSGNVVDDMVVKSGTGHVSYSLYESKRHFEPFIMLAPYFFPLLSLPMLIAAIVFEQNYGTLVSLLLGMALGIDLRTAWFELYPNQSDLQRIQGGFLPAALFIGGANFLWTFVCFLWVQAGLNGYLEAGALTLHFIDKLLFS